MRDNEVHIRINYHPFIKMRVYTILSINKTDAKYLIINKIDCVTRFYKEKFRLNFNYTKKKRHYILSSQRSANVRISGDKRK